MSNLKGDVERKGKIILSPAESLTGNGSVAGYGCVTENSGDMPVPKSATCLNWKPPNDKPYTHGTQSLGSMGHLARTLAAQTGMTNKWLYGQGLISVKEKWVKIHYPVTAR